KGFGQKTQDSVKQGIEFYLSNRERFLYAEIATLAQDMEKRLQQMLAPAPVSLTGQIRRTEVIIDEIELVAGVPAATIRQHLGAIPAFTLAEETAHSQLWRHEQQVKLRIYPCQADNFVKTLFITTGDDAFLEHFDADGHTADRLSGSSSEVDIFQRAGM